MAKRGSKKKKKFKNFTPFCTHTLDAIAFNPTPGGAAVNFYRIFFRSVFLYLFFNVILFAREQTGGFFFCYLQRFCIFWFSVIKIIITRCVPFAQKNIAFVCVSVLPFPFVEHTSSSSFRIVPIHASLFVLSN